VKGSDKSKLTRRQQRDLDIEIKFLEGLIRRDPDYADALQLLGLDYTQRGCYTLSLRIDRRLARLRPDDPTVLYNLACSCSRNGRIKEAATSLIKAIHCGFDDMRILLRDPDLENLRDHPLFLQVRKHLSAKK
jgi:Flp pilus assembly protein TadD